MIDLLRSFIARYSGVPQVGTTPQNTGQCVGLVEVWMATLGLPHEWGNAKDLLTNADPHACTVVLNTPTNAPLPGDIAVWGSSWGNGNGHTGIVVSATTTQMEAFAQNDPTGSAPHLKTYTYQGVLGWLHPTAPVPPADSSQQHIIDDLRTARDTNWTLYQGEITKNTELSAHVADLQAQLTTLQQHTAQLQGEVADYKAKYDAEQQHTIELNSQLATAHAQMAQIKAESKDYGLQILDAQHQVDAARAQVAQQQKAHQDIVKGIVNTIVTIFWRKKGGI